MRPHIDLVKLAERTYSAAISDACDSLGYRAQTANTLMTPMAGIADRGVLVGWARTALSVPVEGAPTRHYGAEIDFIDSLRKDDVVVITAQGESAAIWGELFSAAGAARGARGALIEGFIRDRDRIDDLGFSVFAAGARPTDSLGRVSLAGVGTPIDVGGVRVSTGDLVVADSDGVVFVPAPIAIEVAELAMSKAGVETDARNLLRGGALLADAWEKYRVL